MPDSLPESEAKRSKILGQLTTLGDLRPGSICAVPRRCGKPSCHCAKPSDPGHDPQLRLTRKVEGKTLAESFPSPAAWRKAQAEVDEYRRFQQLSAEPIAVNEQICRHRPLEPESGTWTPEEKRRLLRSMRRSRAKQTSGCACSSTAGARLGMWTWKPSKRRCARPCIGPEP
ncbi:MAG: DUF6788 family protein [Bryobacteraceae bacterium]